MALSRSTKIVLGLLTALVMAFIYIPLLLVLLNSFNTSVTFAFPPTGFTTKWWGNAFSSDPVRAALATSVEVAVLATLIALVLGTLAAIAVTRFEFFGRDVISLLVVLPIALPGIVTGIALSNLFTSFLGGLSLLTLIVGHATFCVVVVFNNAAARLRRTSGRLLEASADLGARSWFTFRHVTFPLLRPALLAGGLLAFGLSFDEIIVTRFAAGPGVQTLPLWIFNNLFRPTEAPVVNVVAAALVVVSVLPVYLAQRLSGDPAHAGGRI